MHSFGNRQEGVNDLNGDSEVGMMEVKSVERPSILRESHWHGGES